MERKKVLIMGAAGRDFHDFNTVFRDNKIFEVVGFTAAQIPDIAGRVYPKELAGKLYPKGIKIYDESELTFLIEKLKVDEVVFAYSDVSHEYIMHKASQVNAAGANFRLLGPKDTMLKSKKPVISVCAVRTGCGKSQTTRRVCDILQSFGKKVVAVRHPMPYGDLKEQIVERFASYADLDKYECTIEEREEYEPLIKKGVIVYAGVDYEKILGRAEKEADVILWDGGNNDFPFFKSDFEIVVADPLRAGHETKYFHGEVNLRRADVVVINKVDSATPEAIKIVEDNVKAYNTKALIIKANSKLFIEDKNLAPKKVLVIEDGPTLTHGGMSFGAGIVAVKRFFPKAEIIYPEQYAVGSIKATYKKYGHIKDILPAMGYSEEQIKELQQTVNKISCDLVVVATPIDLQKIINLNKPSVRVTYELDEIGNPNLNELLKKLF